jgi:hypothetical protein
MVGVYETSSWTTITITGCEEEKKNVMESFELVTSEHVKLTFFSFFSMHFKRLADVVLNAPELEREAGDTIACLAHLSRRGALGSVFRSLRHEILVNFFLFSPCLLSLILNFLACCVLPLFFICVVDHPSIHYSKIITRLNSLKS